MDATMGFEQPAASVRPTRAGDLRTSGIQTQPQPQPQPDNTIPEGAYGVIHQGELVFVSSDIGQVRAVIEDWVLEHQVPIGALTVFKNVPIGFGVILEQS